MTARAAVAAALVAIALPVAVAAAAAGDLDDAFGAGGGLAATPFGPGARASALAVAPDGRLLVAGDVRAAGGESFLTARFTAAGTLDPGFASTGGRLDRFGSGEPQQRGRAVLAQPDGGVLVAGAAGDALALARFGPDGLADGLFGAGGVALRDVPGGGLPEGTGLAAIAPAPDGQIVVAGSVGIATDDDVPGEQIVVGRFSPRGLPDPGFGRDGFVLLQLGAGSPRAHAMSAARAVGVLDNGRIVIAGDATDRAGDRRAFVARLTATGALDTTFARGGRLLVQIGKASARRAASSRLDALDVYGRAVVATGTATDVAGDDAVAFVGLSEDGRPAPGGNTVLQLGATTGATAPRSASRAVATRADGTAIVAGGATGGVLAARYFLSGGLDCGFARGGRTLAFGAPGFDPAVDGADAVVLDRDGILLAGRRAGGGLLLGRLNTAPQPVAHARPRLVTLAPVYTGHGRGYAYGLVDGACRSRSVRFEISGPGGRTVRTSAQRVSAAGPQVFCAPLRGLRRGVRYRIRAASVARTGPRAATRVLRAVASGARMLPQEGCA